jgi:hypothetical protein
MSGYGQATTWGQPPQKPPSWSDTQSKAYFAGIESGKQSANGVSSNTSSYLNSVHKPAYHHGYNSGFKDQFDKKYLWHNFTENQNKFWRNI